MDKLMTPDEVAELLGIRKNTVYLWAQEGRLAHFKVGNRLRFRRDDVEIYLASVRVPA